MQLVSQLVMQFVMQLDTSYFTRACGRVREMTPWPWAGGMEGQRSNKRQLRKTLLSAIQTCAKVRKCESLEEDKANAREAHLKGSCNSRSAYNDCCSSGSIVKTARTSFVKDLALGLCVCTVLYRMLCNLHCEHSFSASQR
jgi:hypothetical protein